MSPALQPPFRLIDGHVHVASMRFTPVQFVAGVARNILAAAASANNRLTESQVMRLLIAEHQDHHADELVRQMDQAGISQAVLLAPDFSFALEVSENMAAIALGHHEIRLRHPGRFLVFLGYDPRSGPEGLDGFERDIRQYDFEGLKLYPPCGYSPSDESLFPVYELCGQLGLPVLLHTGPTSPVLSFEYSNPALIDRAARQFPGVNFILAHGGVNYVEEALLMCAYRPNVYLDFSAFPAALAADGWVNHLARLFRSSLNHKVIFGTDWPVCRATVSHESVVRKLLAQDGPFTGLSKRDRQNVMGGNILRLVERRLRPGSLEY
jgi:uncharacterized protein